MLEALLQTFHVARFIAKGGKIVLCNKPFADLFGYASPEALSGVCAADLFADPSIMLACQVQGQQHGGELGLEEFSFIRADGCTRTVRGHLYFSADPNLPEQVEGFLLDITLQQEQELYYRQLFDLASEAIAVIDVAGRVYDVNQRFCELTGYSRGSMLNEDFNWWRCCVSPDELVGIKKSLSQLCDTQVGRQPSVRLELTVLHKDSQGKGEEEKRWPILASFTRLERRLDWESDRLLAVMTDIRALKEMESELRTMSFMDSLTGLHNKRFLEQSIAIACEQRSGMIGLIAVDVNYLKLVNDSKGHDVGDHLLQRTARLLKTTCRSADLCARTGGDEFCVLLYNITENELQHVLRRLKAAMMKERQQDQADGVPFSLAIGGAWSPTPCHFKELFRRADQLMYQDKVTQKQQDYQDGIICFDPRAQLPVSPALSSSPT